MSNLKKAAITSIIVLLFLIGVTLMSFAGNTGIVTEEAKLRKTASEDSIVLEIIPKKEEVEILEEEENWYKVKYNKIKGYVLKEFIKVEETAETNTVQKNENQVTNERKEEIKKLQQGDTAITKSEAKVYIRPLINSLVITNIEKDSKVEIKSIINNWAYINSENTNGWVILDNLEIQSNETNTEKENNDASTSLNKTVYISTSGINFRKEPNTDSEVLRVFVENTKVTLISEEDGWCKIEYKDQVGYVVKTYVSDKKVTTTSRSGGTRTTTTKTTTQQKNTTKAETSTNNTATTSSAKGQEVANYAKKFVGCRYVYGGSGPSSFDCSGLTMYVYKKFGVSLPHSATAQSKIGTKVARENLQPGDLIFFRNYRTNKGIGHVGIYIGNNKFVHASTEKTGVITSTLSGSYSSRFVTATRLINN